MIFGKFRVDVRENRPFTDFLVAAISNLQES